MSTPLPVPMRETAEPATPRDALTAAAACAVLELRQYTLVPGQRDVLIALFDREFVETQEAVGMHLIGQFRDLDRPDHFVWIRGFPDMRSRAESLQAFYGGPVWQAHREAANATMIDSDNVLLLRPAGANPAFAMPTAPRAAVGTSASPSSRVVAFIYSLDAPVDDAFRAFFDAELTPALAEAGIRPIARLETEDAENTFPRLPVRTGEHVFVALSAVPAVVASPLQRLRLEPTRRSAMYFSPA